MNPISIVVPDGSMQETVVGLFSKAGLPVVIKEKRTKEGVAGVDWITRVAFQRPQEIPHYINGGHFDVAIVGEDWIANWGYEFPVLLRLPIGRGGNKPVKIVLAVSRTSGIHCVDDLPSGCEVATEYVQLVRRFFDGRGRNDVVVVPSFGNTEHKIKFGATAIVDVTESGASLKENHLEIIHKIMDSHTVIVSSAKSLSDGDKRPYIDCFVRLIKGAHQASQFVMIIANVPEKVIDAASIIMDGLKGASRSPLTIEGWVALESVVPREEEHKVIFELLQIGVVDIIVNRQISLIMT